MMVPKTISLYLIFFLATSCYYDVEEELYPKLDCDSISMSYSLDISPIISENCFQCHSAMLNLGNVNLEGHAGISKYALNGKLSGVIKHKPGFSPMPQGAAKLLDCDISKIESWVEAGAPNN